MNREEEQLLITVPSSVANLQLADPFLLNEYKLKENRIIFVQGTIGEECDLCESAKQILLWNLEDLYIPRNSRKPIYVFVYSNGGDSFQSYSMISAMESSITPIYTVNFGIALSNGLTILLAGEKRFAMKRSTALYHAGSLSLSGAVNEVNQMQEHLKKMDKAYDSWVCERTGIDPKYLAKKNKLGDWYIGDEEQVKHGIVDKLVDRITDIFDTDFLNDTEASESNG